MSEFEQIERYLKNELSGRELEIFEKKLQADAIFRKEVEDYRSIYKGFDQLKAKELRANIKEWSKELPDIETTETAKTIELPRRKTFSILRKLTAAMLVIAVGAYFLWPGGNESDPIPNDFTQNFYHDYFDDKLRNDIQKNKITETIITLENALGEFISENYNTCISEIQKIPRTDSLYLKGQYLQVYAFYKSEKYKNTISTYDQIENLKDNDLYFTEGMNFTDAEWTAILASIKIFKAKRTKQNKAVIKDRVQTLLTKLQKIPPSKEFDKKYTQPAKQLQDWLE